MRLPSPGFGGSWEEAFLPALPTDGGCGTKSQFKVLIVKIAVRVNYCPLMVVRKRVLPASLRALPTDGGETKTW